METNTAETKKGLFQNDRMFVCSMFVFYGACFIGVLVLMFWGLDRRNKTISANATATGVAIATQQAQATTTAIVRLAEQEQYEFVERFDKESASLFFGIQNNEYWEGEIKVEDGVYVWDVEKVKKTFVYWEDMYKKGTINDFDAYVDVKLVEGPYGGVCGGLIFRKSLKGWNQGAYTFSICNDSHVEIYYHGADGWDAVAGSLYSDSIYPTDWNRIEVSAQGDRFVFTINNQFVIEMSDDRQKEGGLSVFIDIGEQSPAIVWFDNFGYQSR